jgi:hypothetical protein
MRQKLITLCPTSFELASKKANFSSWVRRQLLQEQEKNSIPEVLYGMYCVRCDVNFKHPVMEMAKIYRCRHCDRETDYMGRLE